MLKAGAIKTDSAPEKAVPKKTESRERLNKAKAEGVKMVFLQSTTEAKCGPGKR